MILVAINDFLEVPFYSKKIIYRFKKKKKIDIRCTFECVSKLPLILYYMPSPFVEL